MPGFSPSDGAEIFYFFLLLHKEAYLILHEYMYLGTSLERSCQASPPSLNQTEIIFSAASQSVHKGGLISGIGGGGGGGGGGEGMGVEIILLVA